MQVADVDDVFLGVVAQLVGFTITNAALDAATGHPHREPFYMMVASGSALSLEHGSASEFPTPDHQCVIQHVALLEILDEGPGGLVGQAAAGVHVLDQPAVVVPAAMVEMDEPYAALGQPAGQQAVGGVGTIAGFGSVHFEYVPGFL